MEEEIDLKELFDIFWKKKLIIIVVTALFATIGICYTRYLTVPKYKSSTTLLLVQNSSAELKNEEKTNEITQTDITLNETLVSTYSVLIKSKNVLGQVIANLNLQEISEEELAADIMVKAVEDTQVIEITYTNADNKIAYLVANELANVFSQKVVEIYNINNVYIVDKAELAKQSYNIHWMKNMMLSAIAGFGLTCVTIFAISLFDTTVKTAEELEKSTGLVVLAQIPDMKTGGDKR